MSDQEPKLPTPQLLIEKLAAGELDAAEAKAVRARLEAEPDGRSRLAAIERSNAEVLAAYPAARMTRDIEDKLRVSRAREQSGARRSPWWLGLPVVAATAALLLVVVLPSAPEPSGVSDDETILTKGIEPRLRVFVDDSGGSRPLRSGEVLSAGDVLQLAYVAGGRSYGVVVSVDGRGEVTRHLPERGDEAAALRSGTVRLAHAYELDDAPSFERFFFVTSSTPFALPAVLDAARSLAASGGGRSAELALPKELSQVSFLVEKDGGGAER